MTSTRSGYSWNLPFLCLVLVALILFQGCAGRDYVEIEMPRKVTEKPLILGMWDGSPPTTLTQEEREQVLEILDGVKIKRYSYKGYTCVLFYTPFDLSVPYESGEFTYYFDNTGGILWSSLSGAEKAKLASVILKATARLHPQIR